MSDTRHLRLSIVALAVFVAAALVGVRAGQTPAVKSVAVDSDDNGAIAVCL